LQENPYEPPNAVLEESAGSPRPAIGWRLYSAFLILMACLTYAVLGVGWLQAADVLDLLISATSLAGLVGYAFQRCFGAARFWRQWLPLAVTWDALYEIVLTRAGIAGQLPDPNAVPSDFADLVIVVVLLVPVYVGLYRYGYRSDALWSADDPD
jgi:hypothetical protein